LGLVDLADINVDDTWVGGDQTISINDRVDNAAVVVTVVHGSVALTNWAEAEEWG